MKMARLALWAAALALASSAHGYTLVDNERLQISVHGDFIGGAFDDRALINGSSGRERQWFKMSRGLLGFRADHVNGWGGVFEYNFLADEPKRVEGNAVYVDYYKNYGTDLLYYGDFKVRNAYVSRQWRDYRYQLRIGRMVNIIGFDEEEVPFYGRNDSPQAYFIDKEILNGLAFTNRASGYALDLALLSGRGRPDGGYHIGLNGQLDPNTKGNHTPIVEARFTVGGAERFLRLSYHETKLGSASSYNVLNGKHIDRRASIGFKLTSGPALGLQNLLLLGQVSRFTLGLTEDGAQGATTPTMSEHLEKDGWFVTAGLRFSDTWALYYTLEEIDRIDPLVWSEIANFDPTHEAFDKTVDSEILQIDYRINRYSSVTAYYRWMDFDYTELSGIPESAKEKYGLDKWAVYFRYRF